MTALGIIFGFIAWFLLRYLIAGIYTVDQNERAVKTIFGRAERLPGKQVDDPMLEFLRPDERDRYLSHSLAQTTDRDVIQLPCQNLSVDSPYVNSDPVVPDNYKSHH